MQDGGSKFIGSPRKWLEYNPKHVVARYILVWVLLFATICALTWVALSARQFRLAKSSRPVRLTNETWVHLDPEQVSMIPHNRENGVWCTMHNLVFMRCSFDDVFRHIDFALVGNADHGYHFYIQCEMFYDSGGDPFIWPTTCAAWIDHYPTSKLPFFIANYSLYLFRAYASKAALVAIVSAAATYVLSFATEFVIAAAITLRKNKWYYRPYSIVGMEHDPDSERIEVARTLRLAFGLAALCLVLSLCGFFVHRAHIHRERFSHAPVLSDKFLRADIASDAGGILCARNSSADPFTCQHPNTWQQVLPLLAPGDSAAAPFMFCESTLLLDGGRVVWPATCHVHTENRCIPTYQCSVFSPFGGHRTPYETYYAVGGGLLAIVVTICIDLLANFLSMLICDVGRQVRAISQYFSGNKYL